jgi:pyruvate,water dikinase
MKEPKENAIDSATMPFVVGGDETDLLVESASQPAALQLGGKAANLLELDRLGLEVPSWFVITSAAFEAEFAQNGLRAKIADALEDVRAEDDLVEITAEIRAWICEMPVSSSLAELIDERFERVIDQNVDEQYQGGFAAVRSSATDEDGEALSFAGIHDSLLFVPPEDAVDAVRQVWASAFNERAVRYRLREGLDPTEASVAVIIQQMVRPHVSGVIFTAHPATEDVEQVLVETVWGAGEGLVGKGLPADSFLVDKLSDDIETTLADKETQFLFATSAGRGLEECDVAEHLQSKATLDDDQLRTLVETSRRIETHYGRPQDIEFCIDATGRIHWLQSRPVTTVHERGPAVGNRLVWDNSNIIESYSGVTTPMTFSFIEHAYTIVYHCFSEVMGVDQKTVRANMPVFENMLGLIRGEVYYNLQNWYRLIRLFPGFSFNKSFMESMMGLDEPLGDEPDDLQDAGLLDKASDFGALLSLVVRSTRNFACIETVVSDFQAHFDEQFDQYADLDFHAMQPHEIMEIYQQLEQQLLWQWKAPIINDFYVMIFYGLLVKVCEGWCGDEDATLHHDLICGEGGIATKEASNELLRLAAMARERPVVGEVLAEAPLDEVLDTLAEMPEAAPFLAGVHDYLDMYGYRSMNELKLESPTMRDNPAFLLQMIRNYLRGDPDLLDLDKRRERELDIRHKAEERAFASLSLPRKLLFKRVLRNARRGVKNRENLRFSRTKIYGLVREMLLAVSATFVREDILDDEQDIFYLKIDEVWGFIKGTAVTTNLRGVAELRRAEFEAYEQAPDQSPDDRFVSYGMVNHANLYRRRRKPQAVELEDGMLGGIGCCSGVVEGPVKIIRTPSDDMSMAGEILVADRTDPGWVPLYPSASGILIERGSVLSHSAIVAREMGIPTIVGVDGLIDALESGDRVRMDGQKGTIELLADEGQ